MNRPSCAHTTHIHVIQGTIAGRKDGGGSERCSGFLVPAWYKKSVPIGEIGLFNPQNVPFPTQGDVALSSDAEMHPENGKGDIRWDTPVGVTGISGNFPYGHDSIFGLGLPPFSVLGVRAFATSSSPICRFGTILFSRPGIPFSRSLNLCFPQPLPRILDSKQSDVPG